MNIPNTLSILISLILTVTSQNTNFFKGLNTPPTVTSIVPNNGATNVSPNSNVIITFDEAVLLGLDKEFPLIDNSVIIDCTISGMQSYPNAEIFDITIVDIELNDFINGDICTVTISAFWVHDIDDLNHFDGNGDGYSSPVDDDFISTFSVGELQDAIYTNGFE